MIHHPGMIQLYIIAGYLALLLGLGLFSSLLFRGTSKDYMLASHSIGPVLLLMSLFGTTMTAFALVGSTGESFKEGVGVYGMLASSSGIIHSLCFFLLGVKLWGFGHKYGYTTQIQYFRDRLDSDKIGLLLFPILVGLVIPYLLIGVMASGTVINKVTAGKVVEGKLVDSTFEEGTFPSFLELGKNPKAPNDPPSFLFGSQGGVPKPIASLVICGIVLIYVFFGGMRGTAWANTFQTCVFMVLGIVTFDLIAEELGSRGIVKYAVEEQGLSQEEADAQLAEAGFVDKLSAASSHIPEEKLTRTHVSKLKFFTYLLVPLSVGMFPHLFQHWLTARSASSFKLAIVAHPIFIMIVWVPCVLIGAWATTGLINIPPPVAANPNAVLPFLVGSLSGPVLGGLLTAGILAAIMSSLDSQFLCIGTMFTEDIAVHYGGKKRFSDKQTVLMARIFIVLIVAVTYGFSLFEPRRVFTLGVWCFSGFSALFPLVVASVYWKRMTKAGAYAAILAAIGSWAYMFWQSGFAEDDYYGIKIPVGGEVYEMMPVAGMVACSTLALVIVSLATKPPSEKTLSRFFS